MKTFAPELLATWTDGQWTVTPVAPLPGFAADTRTMRPGQVFVALKTEKRDGHLFLADAQNAGAGAALVAKPDLSLKLPQLVVRDPLAALQTIAREHRRAFRGKVIGISGSAGKTSTKDLLALLLGGGPDGVLATEGNLNNHIGVPLTLTRLDPARHAFAVIEAGVSGPGEMLPLAEMIEPDVAIITLVAAAHTQALGGLEGVAHEKARLPRAVRTGGVTLFPKACLQFTAFQDLFVNQLVLERSTILRPATKPRHTIHFNVLQRPDETAIVIAYGPPSPVMFKMRRVTDGMAQNAALALTAALAVGIPPEALRGRLAAWNPGKLRGEIRREDGRLLYLDCYNANPASMADALATFAAIAPPAEPRLFILGCMEELGVEAPGHHYRLGLRLPLRDGDRLMVIGTYADEVCRGVLEQGNFARQIQICSTLEPMAAEIAEWRGAVFIKGSRRYQLERALDGSAREVVHA
jgi:UDP-N-acetylmuramoyl-tripeptide--D-alanyl-D-alanine ligase